MAKKVIVKEAKFNLNSVKGHSVRYDADNTETGIATSIYVRKDAFESAGGNNFPTRIKLTLEALE